MFKNREITLNRVYDTIAVREGNTKHILHVNGDASRMSVGLLQAQKRLQTINENTTDAEREEITRYFSDIIFGEEQTQKLFDYYYGDASCVIAVCGKYFAQRLSKLITKAQKKIIK